MPFVRERIPDHPIAVPDVLHKQLPNLPVKGLRC
jgi:hypothetical protein